MIVCPTIIQKSSVFVVNGRFAIFHYWINNYSKRFKNGSRINTIDVQYQCMDSLFSQFMLNFSYPGYMDLVVFAVPADDVLASIYGFRCFRRSCTCFLIILTWILLFSQFLLTFSHHEPMDFAVFAMSAGVFLLITNIWISLLS